MTLILVHRLSAAFTKEIGERRFRLMDAHSLSPMPPIDPDAEGGRRPEP
jgi:hypothetical protein